MADAMSAQTQFDRLPTSGKLLLILTLFLLPIGLALAWFGEMGVRSANNAISGQAQDRSRIAARSIESLLARNALALRIAANAAVRDGVTPAACDRMQRALAIVPAVSQQFELEDADGRPVCAVGDIGETGELDLVAPGAILVRVSPRADAVAVRTGVMGAMATAVVPLDEIRDAANESGAVPGLLQLKDHARQLNVIEPTQPATQAAISRWPIGGQDLVAVIGMSQEKIAAWDRLVLLLPLLMWILAALITWLLVGRLLIRPLKRLERAVIAYQPGEIDLDLPENLGPSQEIEALRDAFSRAIARVDESERLSADALEGQRRLVREVHHRVKNNLQVVASLLNIHGRTANSPDVRAAYAAISRRVGALSVVHRNHFAEIEENRGIALRPMLSELSAELRVSAPEQVHGLTIDLDLDTVHTTQDVAVAIAFLITEIVEYAMLNAPSEAVEISLRRTSELTARLTIASKVLTTDGKEDPERQQFERIVSGLAKQLRSNLERKLGRYSVDFPVFPPN
jgi:two-component sensor histidine kinase